MSNIRGFSVFDKLIKKAKSFGDKTIVLPEASDERVIWAANKAVENNICKVILIGDPQDISPKLSKKYKDSITIIDPKTSELTADLAKAFYELRKHKGITQKQAAETIKNNIYFATMLVKVGKADGMVAGCNTHTADVLRPAFQIIKTKPGITKASSCFIMESPDPKNLGENGFLVMGDCAVLEKPTPEDLADIAISSAETAKVVCGINPRVAMLSYSSKVIPCVDVSEDIKKVKQACDILSSKNPDFVFDGELQADSALVPSVAKRKVPNSKLSGNANVLIFPDLNSGNIAYKLAQIFGKVHAVGPLLQGLNMPINDLSRSASAEEIYLTIALTILQTK